MLKTGKGNSIFELLTDLDEKTKFESYGKTMETAQVNIDFSNQGIAGWNIQSGQQNGEHIKTGSGMNALLKYLEDISEESKLDERLSVLCLSQVKDLKKAYRTTWIKIDPYAPFVLKKGHPEFETIQIVLNKKDLAAVMEVKIALFNEYTKVLYPILKVACQSFGKLMDSEAAFKYQDDVPLGTALILSKKLLSCRNIRFIHRSYDSGKVKPLVGIAGAKYVKYSQLDFFKTAYEICCQKGPCKIGQWSIMDDRTVMKIELDPMSSACNPYILLQTSDVPGSSLSVTAYAGIGAGSLLLKSNSSYHLESFGKKGGVKTLFTDIFEIIEKFDISYRRMENEQIEFNMQMLAPIIKTIGKKRAMTVGEIKEGIYTSAELIRLVIDKTFFALGSKQAKELEKAYTDFFMLVDKGGKGNDKSKSRQ